MQQFYIPTLTKEDKEFYFDKIESKHLSKVLRKKSEMESQLSMVLDIDSRQH